MTEQSEGMPFPLQSRPEGVGSMMERVVKEKWVANLLTATHPSNSKIRIEETLLRLWYRL